MAMTTVPKFHVPAMWPMNGAGNSLSSAIMNASGDRMAFVIQCPKAGQLDWFEFRTAAVANNPDNGLRLSFQDINLATGDPDGTQDQYCDITGTIAANTWQVPPNAMTNTGAGGGVKRTVGSGELLGLVVDFVSFVASDTVAVSFLSVPATGNRNWYFDDGATGAYIKQTLAAPILALKYSDGTYAEFDVPAWPVMASTALGFNSGSTPDERALRFQVGTAMRAVGFWAVMDTDGPVDVVFYDASGSTIDTVSFGAGQRNTANALYYTAYFPSGPVDLAATTTYRLSVKPTSGTNIGVLEFDVPTAAHQACIPGGVEWYLSTRTDAGSWTDTTTKRPQMGLVFDGVDTGGGGGGGESPTAYFG